MYLVYTKKGVYIMLRHYAMRKIYIKCEIKISNTLFNEETIQKRKTLL